METVLNWLIEYEYLAMVGILLLCGVGLPLPEEVTLIASGLLVGWHEANFWLASLACALGILGGDGIIYGLGYRFGDQFLHSRPMRLIFSGGREQRVQNFFSRHGTKALFLARFFPGVRIGVYAYAGSRRLAWGRFLLLDAMGVAISGPTSIAAGRWAGQAFADNRAQAIAMATHRAHDLGRWVLIVLLLSGGALLLLQRIWRRLARRQVA